MTNEATTTTTRPTMTEQAFAILGGGKIAYVKPIRSEDVHKLYPQAPELQPGMSLYALHAADAGLRRDQVRDQLLMLARDLVARQHQIAGLAAPDQVRTLGHGQAQRLNGWQLRGPAAAES